jgi:pimeloyl-ACP methyl ester carboxylesterase
VTRNAHDFDYFSNIMKEEHHLVCPDVVGRGESDHLISRQGYDYLQYNADMNALLARIDKPKVDWLGTSMGGIIGMVLARLPQSPIKRLILNDIGPEITRDSLNAIGEYIGRAPEFRSRAKLKEYIQKIYTEFHPMTDKDWDEMAEHSTIRTKTGKYQLRMDPAVGEAFRESISLFDVDMWDTWEAIHCPILILRGKESSFFSAEVANKMLETNSGATLVEFEGAGHTPTLRDDHQVNVIRDWLAKTDT